MKNKIPLCKWSFKDLLDYLHSQNFNAVYTEGNIRSMTFDTISAVIQWQAEKSKVKTLKVLPEHMRTKRWILSEIKYENASGIHTYHKCECGRKKARNVMCSLCWGDYLKAMEGE